MCQKRHGEGLSFFGDLLRSMTEGQFSFVPLQKLPKMLTYMVTSFVWELGSYLEFPISMVTGSGLPRIVPVFDSGPYILC